MKNTADQNVFKQAAAQAAAELLQDGMIVGLGSGTTATLATAAIAERVRQGLRIVCISTSEQTSQQAAGLGITLSTLEEHPEIDLAIDGADEVETGTLNLIKGGGGNQLREKIVAVSSKRFVIIVDESKIVRQLGSRAPVPVEIVPFGWRSTQKRLERMGANPTLRLDAAGRTYVTDGGNYILDCAYGPIHSAEELQSELDGVVGVVEHGLFIGLASEVLIGGADGVKTLQR